MDIHLPPLLPSVTKLQVKSTWADGPGPLLTRTFHTSDRLSVPPEYLKYI